MAAASLFRSHYDNLLAAFGKRQTGRIMALIYDFSYDKALLELRAAVLAAVPAADDGPA